MSEEIDRYDAQTGCKNKDCYYKQLQRLKQENEFLIKKYVAALKNNEAKTLNWIEFQGCKKENEQLKKQLEFSRTHKIVLDAEKIKYKQAFEEIREQLKAVSNLAPSSTRNLKYAIEDIINEVLDEQNKLLCQDCTDCVMKQIVEKCRNKNYFVKKFPNAQFSSGVQNSELAFDILQLLDIQEVE